MSDNVFNIETSINWELFTPEQKGLLTACFQNGEVYNLSCLPGVEIDTPEKEQEIEKMVLELLPFSTDDSESDVRKKIDAFWATNEEMTPEKEAEFEMELQKEKKKNKKEIIEEEIISIVEDFPTEEIVEEEKPKAKGRPKKIKDEETNL